MGRTYIASGEKRNGYKSLARKPERTRACEGVSTDETLTAK